MRKPIAFLCTALLSASCLFTVGCGSNANNATTDTADAAKTEAAQPADPKEAFVGTWKLAAAETQGLVMSGDLTQILGDNNLSFTFNADGTGTSNLGDDEKDLTWTADSAEKATITNSTGDQTQEVTLKDDALRFDTENDGKTVTVIFTKDGTYAGAKTISLDGSKPITSESELLGTWKITGINIAGISAYGPAESLEALANGTDTSMTFKEGGVVESSGTTSKWSVSSDGAVLEVGDEETSYKCPIVMLDDGIAIDMSGIMKELMGTDVSLIAVYSK